MKHHLEGNAAFTVRIVVLHQLSGNNDRRRAQRQSTCTYCTFPSCHESLVRDFEKPSVS